MITTTKSRGSYALFMTIDGKVGLAFSGEDGRAAIFSKKKKALEIKRTILKNAKENGVKIDRIEVKKVKICAVD